MKIAIEARGGHNGIATGGHYGSWAQIWASRDGITKIAILEEYHTRHGGRNEYHDDRIVVDVVPTGDFGENVDYILIEYKRSPNPYLRGSSMRESYELVAGKMPTWAAFPGEWRKWINDKKVNKSAIAHIENNAPWKIKHDISKLIDYAGRKTSKGNIRSGWDEIQKLLLDFHTLKYTPEHTHSWTGVKAMPIKIASAMRAHWKPPVPRPRYQNREESGAILICSPETINVALQ